MQTCRDETINGFNVFVREQKAQGGNADLTLVQFDSGGVDTTMDAVAIDSAIELSTENYVPRASTPLLDALGTTIIRTGMRFSAMPEGERPEKVVFVIITDGCENASHEYSRATIKHLIEQQQKHYNWQFIYLGANQDAFAEAGSIGIHAQTVSNYATASSVQAFASTGSNLRAYREGGATMDSLAYSDDQRAANIGSDHKKQKSK